MKIQTKVTCGLLALWSVAALNQAGAHIKSEQRSQAAVTAERLSPLPVVAEHRYRMAGKIRALLLFWIGKDNVGSARIVWRRGESGEQGFELLIGSDPSRAPRRVNRWGYIEEETRGQTTRIVGVMKQSDEESLKEAESRMADEATEGYPFKMIEATVTATTNRAVITTFRSPLDFTYRELARLLDAMAGPDSTRKTATHQFETGTRPGLLTALAGLVHETVEAHRRSPGTRVKFEKRTVPYVYNDKIYDLSLRSARLHDEFSIDGRPYKAVIEADFQIHNRTSGNNERFGLVYGTEGPYAEVPLQITYQPRWWFKADLVLDESQEFDRVY